MLHLNVINVPAQKLLFSLQEKKYMSSFALAGGTALALHFGHRKSIDIDLFSVAAFDPLELMENLRADYKDFNYTGSNRFMLFSFINNVKTDLILHSFNLLSPVEMIDNIKIFSLQDMAAMKLFAITKRGTKKDFYDVHELLKKFSVKEMTVFFSEKYGYENLWLMQNSIFYFTDADVENDPQMLLENSDWHKVKKEITKAFKTISF